MTEYKKRCLELRRMRFECEANKAKRAEHTENIIKVAAFVVASIILTVCAYVIVRDYQEKTRRVMEANGLAGIALFCADVDAGV